MTSLIFAISLLSGKHTGVSSCLALENAQFVVVCSKTFHPPPPCGTCMNDRAFTVLTAWHYTVKSGTFKLSSVFTWINSLRNEVRVVVGGGVGWSWDMVSVT